MIVAVTIVAIAISFQPLQGPQEKGVPKGGSTQNEAASEHANKSQEPSPQINPATASQPTAERNKPDAARDASDINVQRKIEVFTGVLAVVGVFQLVVMFLTWLVYRRQAREMGRQRHEMRRQRHVMFRQWKAMGEQAKLMKEQSELMVEKERAKLRIELDEFLPIKDEHEIYWVKGHVSIYGSTEAFIERTEIYASIGPAGIFNPLPEWLWGLHLPSVIRNESEPTSFAVMVMAEDGPATASQLLPVREAKEFIYCMAKIEFADTYGRKWVFRLRRRFGFIWPQVQSTDIGGRWEDSGPETNNGEYRKPN